MRRLILYIVASLVVTAFVAWMIALPGTVSLQVAGYQFQPRLGTVVLLVVILMGGAILLWAILRRIIGLPRFLARRTAERRRAYGVDALSEGLIALEAGEPERARQLARDAGVRLSDNAAAQLLEARANLAMGDMSAAREQYRTLIANPRTAVAALSGLYEQARTQGRGDAALQFARRAVRIAPRLTWASNAVFDDLTAKKAWAEALDMIKARPAPGKEEKQARKRQQAVLETAIARDLEETEPLDALNHAQAALKLLPDFVPAALIAARIEANRDEARRASSLLRRVWRATGHPDVATLYINVKSGAPAVERLKRARALIDGSPSDRAAAIVLARAAIDAYEWSAARNALAGFAASDPTQDVCTLMAEIEEGQNGDQGKARQWLARAVHAPRDPVWTADGVTSDEWEPASPVTGKLDAFAWKVPVSTVAPRTPDRPAPQPAAPAEIADTAPPEDETGTPPTLAKS